MTISSADAMKVLVHMVRASRDETLDLLARNPAQSFEDAVSELGIGPKRAIKLKLSDLGYIELLGGKAMANRQPPATAEVITKITNAGYQAAAPHLE